MKKRYLSMLLALLMVLALLPFSALAAPADETAAEPVTETETAAEPTTGEQDTEPADEQGSDTEEANAAFALQFELREDSVAIVGYTGEPEGLVTLPEQEDSLPVTAIEDEAFKGCDKLVAVVVPDSITEIGDSAFADCTALRYVQLSSKLTDLGAFAFSGCTAMTGIVIPESVTALSGTFSGCTALKNITLYPTMKTIYRDTFAECKALTTIHFMGKNTDIPKIGASQIGNDPIFNGNSYQFITAAPDPLFYFFDLPSRAGWAWDGVSFCITEGLMTGTDAAKCLFNPSGTTTRAQLVTILWRCAGSPAPKNAAPFTDLRGKWYRDSVAWAAENNIVAGITATTFAPDNDVTREQMTAIFYRYCTEYLGMSKDCSVKLDEFSDASSVSKYARDAFAWSVERGLISGTSTKTPTLSPKGTATRAQIATVINRFFHLVNDAAPAEETEPTDTKTDDTVQPVQPDNTAAQDQTTETEDTAQNGETPAADQGTENTEAPTTDVKG